MLTVYSKYSKINTANTIMKKDNNQMNIMEWNDLTVNFMSLKY